MVPRDFNAIYAELLGQLVHSPYEEVNQRTGVKVKMLSGGTSFKLDISDGIDILGVRKLYPRAAAAEVAWFLSGTQDVTWMRQHAPFWDKFVENDGTTIEAAYGYRWREHFGRDQIRMAVGALKQNPTNRRVLVSAWDPASDGLTVAGQKNVPCPTHFTLSHVAGELHSSLFIRSSDVFVGLPYDVIGHFLLLQLFSMELGVPLGSMHVTLAHPHLYEPHWEMAREAVDHFKHWPVVYDNSFCPLLEWDFAGVEADPDGYVAYVKDISSRLTWTTEPAHRPEVVQ